MNPIQVLMDEHRRIEGVLAALDGYVARLGSATPPPRADLGRVVAFIRGYADRHHHGKEEDILFRAMIEAGMPRDMGPLGVMFQEHDEGRGYARALATVAEGEGPIGESEAREIRWAGKSYTALLRGHIQKEDQVLYPMADQMLPEPAWHAIEKAFVAFEEDPANAAQARDLVLTAEALIERYA